MEEFPNKNLRTRQLVLIEDIEGLLEREGPLSQAEIIDKLGKGTEEAISSGIATKRLLLFRIHNTRNPNPNSNFITLPS